MPPEVCSTPIRLFTALTRAVRDGSMPDAVRARALELVTQLADRMFQPGFGEPLGDLLSLAEGDAQLHAALTSYATPLRAMAQAYAQPANDTQIVESVSATKPS